VAHAQLLSWDIDISIDDDQTAQWVVTLEHDEEIKRSDYYVLSRITGIEVIADGEFIDCLAVTQDLGTSIRCDGFSAKKIVYRFRTLDITEKIQNLMRFSYRFSITRLVDDFSVTVRLPLGAGTIEPSKLANTGLKPFEPIWGREGSDGRRIFLEWNIANPELGKTFDIYVIYERIVEFNQLAIIIIILTTISIMLLIAFMFRKRTVKDILPVLTPGERKVMEILLRERKDVDQRHIIKETDFSKAKVSRIIHDLMNRGIVEKIPKGRRNLIRIKKKD